MGRHCSSSITKRVQQFHHHWARTAAPSTLNADSSSSMGRRCSSSITKRAQQFRHHWARTAAPSTSNADSSSGMGRHSSSSTTRHVQQFRHHWARTAARSTSNVDSSSGIGCHCSSSITKCVQQFRQHRTRKQPWYGAPQQLQHHQARTAAPSTSSADSSSGMGHLCSSSITERAHSSAQTFGAQKRYLQSAISREPQPHLGSPRSSPRQSV